MNNPASSHLQWPKGQFAGTCFRIILCLAFTMLFAKPGHSQYAPEFDEIPVLVKFKYLGEAEVPALIYDGKLLLSVSDFFDFLKVQNRLSTEADSVTGFFLHPQDQFLLDYIGNYINYQNKFWELETGELIQSGDRLFLTTRYFQEVFGINCIYNERSLSVIASSEVELPAVRAIRLSQAGQNFRHSSKPFISDTVLGKNFQFFHFGTADWSIIASEQINGQRQARLGLALGGILAGGELNGVLN